MIIFDLDGTLANIDHRRHFVDQKKSWGSENPIRQHEVDSGKWKPDWKAFYNSCDEDKPNQPVIEMWDNRISLGMMGHDQIWSGRCESVREKTIAWLQHHLCAFQPEQLKMRPIADSTPDDQLKERWLDEYLKETCQWPKLGEIYKGSIDCVFDDRPKVIRMWRRRGIFVFNCCQHDDEF